MYNSQNNWLPNYQVNGITTQSDFQKELNTPSSSGSSGSGSGSSKTAFDAGTGLFGSGTASNWATGLGIANLGLNAWSGYDQKQEAKASRQQAAEQFDKNYKAQQVSFNNDVNARNDSMNRQAERLNRNSLAGGGSGNIKYSQMANL